MCNFYRINFYTLKCFEKKKCPYHYQMNKNVNLPNEIHRTDVT